VKTQNNIDPADATVVVEEDDWFKIQGVVDDVNNEWVNYAKDITNLDTAIWTTCVVRWKTSVSSNGLGCQVRLVFDDASNQDVVGLGDPEFSTTWTTTVADITANKVIDQIYLTATDHPEVLDVGTYAIYVDYVLICQDQWPWPYVSDYLDVQFPNRYVHLNLPTHLAGKTQYLGSDAAIINIMGDMDTADEWGTPPGQHLYDIQHNAYDEPFQYFTSDEINCKVTLEDFRMQQRFDAGAQRTYSLTLKEFRRSNGSNDTWQERYGL